MDNHTFNPTFEFLEQEIDWLRKEIDCEENETEKEKYRRSLRSHERALAILKNTQFDEALVDTWVATLYHKEGENSG